LCLTGVLEKKSLPKSSLEGLFKGFQGLNTLHIKILCSERLKQMILKRRILGVENEQDKEKLIRMLQKKKRRGRKITQQKG
jgi:hypothetical protein